MTHRRTAAAVLIAIALPAAGARRTLSTGILRWILSLALVFPLTVTLVPSQAAAVPAPSQAPAETLLLGELAEKWCGTERTSDFKPGWFPQDRPQIKVIYVFANNQGGEFQKYSHLIQKDIKAAVELVRNASGGSHSIAFDLGTDCGPRYVDIASIPLAKSSVEYQKLFGSEAGPTGRAAAIQKEVRTALGLDPSGAADSLGLGGKRNFTVYANIGLLDRINIKTTTNARGDLPGCPLGYSHPDMCKPDNQPGPGNIANEGGYWAWVWEQLGDAPPDQPQPGWEAHTPKGRLAMLHEITHNLGAVQNKAMHGYHCTDDPYDVMCLPADVPYTCYDCDYDTYFNLDPPPGSYLDTHWNVARSTFIVPAGCSGERPTNTPTDGNDIIEGTNGSDVLAGGGGDDRIFGGGGNDLLCGDTGNDIIFGNSGVDRIYGGSGNDELAGGSFQFNCSVVVFGNEEPGTGNGIEGGPGNDKIAGSEGNDTLLGDHGNDCIMGLAGNDYLSGDRGADFIAAGIGPDMALGGRDYDELYGQDGSDKLYAATASILVPQFPDSCEQSGEFGSVDGPPEIGDASRGLPKENLLVGGDGYDRLVGSNRTDNIQGDERGDDLYGFAGPDRLQGGRGADCLSGGPGQDALNDADPNDSQPPDTDTLWGGSHLDQLSALDGDGLDKLDGSIIIRIPPLPPLPLDRCRSDAGDAVTRCTSVP